MPIALIRSISLPNLKIYTTISLLLVSGCIYYSFNVVTTDPHWKLQSNATVAGGHSAQKSQNDAVASVTSLLTNTDLLASLLPREDNTKRNDADNAESILFDNVDYNDTNTFTAQLKDVVSFMGQEPVCIWVSTNDYLFWGSIKLNCMALDDDQII